MIKYCKTAWIPAAFARITTERVEMAMETTKIVQVSYSRSLNLVIPAKAGIQAVYIKT
jgi:hypothetical protein